LFASEQNSGNSDSGPDFFSIRLGDESGPDIRWWENIVITPWLGYVRLG
jgi:hypothetical protein